MNRRAEGKVLEVGKILADGYNGYQLAHEKIKNPRIKSIFQEFALQKRKFLNRLNDSTVKDFGFNLDNNGSIRGYFHRAWNNTKSAFSRNETELVGEALKGEQEALKYYESSLELDLPNNVRKAIEEQIIEIKNSIEKLESIS